MKKIFFISFIILDFSNLAFSLKSAGWDTSSKEELKTVYEKATAWFSSTSNCSVNIAYSSFSDHVTQKAYDHSEGFYRRDNQFVHVSSMGITTIQNKKIGLVVDSINQYLVLRNKAEIVSSPVDNNSLTELLNNVKAIKKQSIANGETAYRIEFRPNAIYEAFEFRINAKGLFTMITYYYDKEVQEDEDDPASLKGRPRMEIVFSGYQLNVKFDYDKEFSEKKYLEEKTGKIILNKEYRNFEVKDYRFDAKK
jgi:hypothetical protein